MSLLQLLRQQSKRNLPELLTKLPHMGVGSRVTRAAWQEYGDSFWEVTHVKPRGADGTVGKAWGVLTWRGERDSKVREIRGRAKRLWRWMPDAQQAAALQPLVAELRQQDRWKREAAAAGQGSGDSGSSSSSSADAAS